MHCLANCCLQMVTHRTSKINCERSYSTRSSDKNTEARKACGTCLKPGASHLSQFFHLEATERGLGRAGKPSPVSWGFRVNITSYRPVEKPCEDPGADPEA